MNFTLTLPAIINPWLHQLCPKLFYSLSSFFTNWLASNKPTAGIISALFQSPPISELEVKTRIFLPGGGNIMFIELYAYNEH